MVYKIPSHNLMDHSVFTVNKLLVNEILFIRIKSLSKFKMVLLKSIK